VSSRRVAVVAGVLLLVVLGTFRSHSEAIPNGTRDEVSIGLWFSPWFERTKEETMVRAESGPGFSGSMNWHWNVEFLSWSWVALGGAIVLLRYGCRRPRVASAP
jgi:hypothetical protein